MKSSRKVTFVLVLLSLVLVSGCENKQAEVDDDQFDSESVEKNTSAFETPNPEKKSKLSAALSDKAIAAKEKFAAMIENGKYSAGIVPKEMTVQEKKQRFRALLVPPTLKVYAELNKRFSEVSTWLAEGKNPKKIAALKVEYRAETDQELLAALKPHPPSIVLAQAAMESAWGTSRFFVKAKNVFGVWSFDKNEPRIAAGEQRGEKTIWLKKYKNVEASVRDNYRVLARSASFKEFRELRMKSTNPYELVKKLDKYSEKGHEYGEELASMISFNKFSDYDPVYHEKP